MSAKAGMFAVGLLALPLYAAESGVYKCSVDGAATYQGTPCGQGQGQQTLIERSVPSSVQQATALKLAEAQSPKGTAVDALVTGMSDTKILNHRQWGRPQQISRSKGEDGWREEWTYLSPAQGTTLLRFVNGRLAGVVSAATPQMASAAPSLQPEPAAPPQIASAVAPQVDSAALPQIESAETPQIESAETPQIQSAEASPIESATLPPMASVVAKEPRDAGDALANR